MKFEKSLKVRAVDLLSRREYSRWELKRKLAPYAETEDEIDRVLNELHEQKWQSDERFAETFINSKSPKHGKLRLQQELLAKGVDRQTAAQFMPDTEQEIANARKVLHKKFRQPAQDLQEKQKQIRFLLYRGFNMDTVQKVLKMDWDDV
ncbi:MAG: recombination regulator RecX [Alysiella sp.]|uniref:recombination regulator RecX n=1 Tax=Alysiella sp. TaxID=1872483 RepID=UPI0026DADF2A|nr:recombination regulator RecX [Alysiella sp.]MDO4433979.1 recombination regulator RecX [Alysiella sp.]